MATSGVMWARDIDAIIVLQKQSRSGHRWSTVAFQYATVPTHIDLEECSVVALSEHLVYLKVPKKYILSRLIAIDVREVY